MLCIEFQSISTGLWGFSPDTLVSSLLKIDSYSKLSHSIISNSPIEYHSHCNYPKVKMNLWKREEISLLYSNICSTQIFWYHWIYCYYNVSVFKHLVEKFDRQDLHRCKHDNFNRPTCHLEGPGQFFDRFNSAYNWLNEAGRPDDYKKFV